MDGVSWLVAGPDQRRDRLPGLAGTRPVVTSVYAATLAKIKGFAALAREDPSEKAPTLARLLSEATHTLQDGLVRARIGLAIGAAIAVGLAWSFSPARARARSLGHAEPERLSPVQLVLPALLAAAAIALYAIAWPMQRENETPWPSFIDGDRLLLQPGTTPDLDGPDQIERAPVMVVTNDGIAVNGDRIQSSQLGEFFQALRDNFQLMEAGAPPDRRLVFACSPAVPVLAVTGALEVAARAGFTRPMFAFTRQEVVDRPLFGHVERIRGSGATVTIVGSRAEAAAGATVLVPAEHPTCAALSSRIVKERRLGRAVALVLSIR